MEKDLKKESVSDFSKKITRKQAIKKAGITALAATSLVFLKTKASACDSCQNHNYNWGGN